MKKMTGLGRGLDALIDTTHVDTNGGSSISEVELNKIVANPDQPRRNFDEDALAGAGFTDNAKDLACVQRIADAVDGLDCAALGCKECF